MGDWIIKQPNGRWKARYRTPNVRTRSRTFDRKANAVADLQNRDSGENDRLFRLSDPATTLRLSDVLEQRAGSRAIRMTEYPEDIVFLDPISGGWATLFDGSDVGLGGLDLDAFHVRGDGSILLSFTEPATIFIRP